MSMFDHDRLGRSLALYEQARDTLEINPTRARAAIADAERSTLAIRAHYCGWIEAKDGDLIAWARHRVATYVRLLGQDIAPEGAGVAAFAIGRLESHFASVLRQDGAA
jgi:hypothetical protein